MQLPVLRTARMKWARFTEKGSDKSQPAAGACSGIPVTARPGLDEILVQFTKN